MGYRIEKGETLGAAFSRIAGEEVAAAMGELRRGNEGEAVHNVRKALKRLRALLRSLRIAFPKEQFRRQNRRLAEAGRKISPLRDVHVQLRTLGRLRAASSAAGKSVRDNLLREQQTISRSIPALRAAVHDMLHQSQGDIARWPLHKATPVKIAAGLKRVFKQGRIAFKIACRRPTPENLHEWRKKVKALAYGFDLIHSLSHKKCARMAERCAELGDALGDDHDLFMVLEALRREHLSHPSEDYAALANRIADKREKLSRRALKMGRRVYDEKPRAFEKRLDDLLRHANKKAK